MTYRQQLKAIRDDQKADAVPERYVSIEEAMQFIGAKTPTVIDSMVRRGEIQKYPYSRRFVRYRLSEISSAMRSRRRKR